jgi:hypothetical protein
MAAVILAGSRVVFTVTGTSSTLTTSTVDGSIIGSEVWLTMLATVACEGVRSDEQLTSHDLVMQFTSALRAMTFRVVLAWVAIWEHGEGC